MLFTKKTKRFGEHEKAFGFLRLLFASLVIIAHCHETADGSNINEPLHRLFGTISLGTISVYGFFIISGYLITSSFSNSKSNFSYLVKRIARIYPGFIVASFFCLFIVAPLAGGIGPLSKAAVLGIVHIFALQPPETENPFAGTYFPALNGAMWTISYEFRCYVLVLVLGLLGRFRTGPWLIAALAILMLVVAKATPDQIVQKFDSAHGHPGLWFGRYRDAFNFFGVFLAGSAFYVFRDRISVRSDLAVVAVIGLALGLCYRPIVEAFFSVFGGYLIFYIASFGAQTFLKEINNKTDVSYGVYLYGWPVMKLLQMYIGVQPVWLIIGLTLAISYVLGLLSWWCVEKPVLQLARTFLSRRETRAMAAGDPQKPVEFS